MMHCIIVAPVMLGRLIGVLAILSVGRARLRITNSEILDRFGHNLWRRVA
jgi:hypothetical protein